MRLIIHHRLMISTSHRGVHSVLSSVSITSSSRFQQSVTRPLQPCRVIPNTHNATESYALLNWQSVKANIYLNLRRDKRAYAQCYRDMAQANPCAATYVLLGEAYMRIQMPEVRVTVIANERCRFDVVCQRVDRRVGGSAAVHVSVEGLGVRSDNLVNKRVGKRLPCPPACRA